MTHTLNAAFLPAVHVRFEGRSQRLTVAQLGIAANATDADIKNAVARFFDVSIGRMHAYVVERHENGNVTLRPEAVFG